MTEAKSIERYLRMAMNNSGDWPCAPFGGRVYHYDRIESTQTQAKHSAASGEPEGALFVARRQSAGYGRKGDAWNSEQGGLWFSVICRPRFGPERAEAFSAACAEACRDAFHRRLPEAAFAIKKPNDVLVQATDGSWKKVCGLILEGSVQDGVYEWLVLGVGVNVNNVLPDGLKPIAVTLEEINVRPVERMPLLREVLIEMARRYGTFQETKSL
ncbi:MAG: biotin--[acetyl-CoA-carboxylase] ligase [Elusimicrobia bacterium]|nr:biotin--[acetyl-CoA-carboxylase] ligase [Elusimicrobiota bacterium]